VRYGAVNAMLLDEFLKERKKAQRHQATTIKFRGAVQGERFETSKPRIRTALNNPKVVPALHLITRAGALPMQQGKILEEAFANFPSAPRKRRLVRTGHRRATSPRRAAASIRHS